MIRSVPACTYPFVKGLEACVLRVYDDARPQHVLQPRDHIVGTLTAGVGHTGGLTVGMVVTPALADLWLSQDLAVAAARLARAVKADVIARMSEHQYAALLSFVFNLGADPSWGFWKVVNAGHLEAVPAYLPRFDKGRVGGKLEEIPGLLHRRQAEAAFWITADAGGSAMIAQAAPVAPPPSSVTREMDTPPTPALSKPPSKSKTFVSACATAGLALAEPVVQNAHGALTSISNAITPYTGASDSIAHASQYLGMGLAGLAVLTVFLAWLKNHEAQQ